MSSIKVVDINNEEVKQEEAIEQPIEEVKEEVNEVVEEAPPETKTVEETQEEPKELFKPVKAQDKLVRCPKCNKEMKMKSLRYNHQQKCQGTLEQRPVKQFSKPRAMPKPKAQPIEQEEEIEEVIQQQKPKLTQEVKNQVFKPQTPNLVDFASQFWFMLLYFFFYFFFLFYGVCLWFWHCSWF